jgi:hypothetical protein
LDTAREAARTERVRRLNTVQIPALRLAGMALVALGVLLHNAVILDSFAWLPWLRITAILLGYALLSWLVLRRFFARLTRFDLGLIHPGHPHGGLMQGSERRILTPTWAACPGTPPCGTCSSARTGESRSTRRSWRGG